ncbi:MAG: hypothetical protein ABW004_10415 [Aeromicrobium sp.]
MIIDPLSFVPLEMDRHLAAFRAAESVRGARSGIAPKRRLGGHRGLRLRLAVWATGRGVHA